jgi:hypothetical protein
MVTSKASYAFWWDFNVLWLIIVCTCLWGIRNIMASGYEAMMEGDPPSDAIWILSSTFIIFTMQSGRSDFGVTI